VEIWVWVGLLDERFVEGCWRFIVGVGGFVVLGLVLRVLVRLCVVVELYELRPEVEGSAEDGCVYEVLN
jgi:hypothetical protein